ncbi:hypothetical protein [Sphingobacterium sp. G1-14]|uniref:hypothetical protein n=1 Tax=Sphingobacterium sp. G1-14 TaxID=2003121 RepID=UPI000B48C786|nr:hypothetical protein [Sphingobacterium sp. G1-14]
MNLISKILSVLMLGITSNQSIFFLRNDILHSSYELKNSETVNSHGRFSFLSSWNYPKTEESNHFPSYVTSDRLVLDEPQIMDSYLEVRTVEELRNMSPKNQSLIREGIFKGIRLLGYYIQGDTPKPIEYHLSNTTNPDDGGSTFKLGQIKLEHNFINEVDLSYFGEKNGDNIEIFRRAIKYASEHKIFVNISKDCFLDVNKKDGSGMIFIDDNTFIKSENSSCIILNQTISPAFVIALSKNIVFKNINFRYDGKYDAAESGTLFNGINQRQVKTWLKKNRIQWANINIDPYWQGPVAYMAMFNIRGSKNIRFENVNIYSSGVSADRFIVWVMKLQPEFTKDGFVDVNNKMIKNYLQESSNVTLENVKLDGTIMGVQGQCANFRANNVKSVRYSNVQGANGDNYGGSIVNGKGDRWMPPPHLFYLNEIGVFSQDSLKITNVYDSGLYVGVKDVKAYSGGYCNSLKLAGVNNGLIDNYKSFRRDGVFDVGNSINSIYRNIYAEYNSSIFDPSFGFVAIRDIVTSYFKNNVIENVTVKDVSSISYVWPISIIGKADKNILKNINVYVNDYSGDQQGFIGLRGSNNYYQANVNIAAFSSKKKYIGIVATDNNTRETSFNNRYDVIVKGWRKLSDDFVGNQMRILVNSNKNLSNTNEVDLIDVSNNITYKQRGSNINSTFTITNIINSTDGSLSLPISLSLPTGSSIRKISVINVAPYGRSRGPSNMKICTDISGVNVLWDNIDISQNSTRILNNAKVSKITKLYLLPQQGKFDFKGRSKIVMEIENIRIGE